MKKLIKKFGAIILTVICIFTTTMFTACGGEDQKIKDFYNKVVESQSLLDIVADDIYSYWYDAIYNDEYNGNINTAIFYAQLDNSENLTIIEENDSAIQSLYKDVRNSDLSFEIKEVMSAYSDYYELVVNVSGSFSTYKANKETLKKELASSLKDLSFEL